MLDFVAGAGFVGIAVALMGRIHPVGIVLAALLFGVLYQGGAELAFDMPDITRDMIVVIQGLVILFAGALEHMFRPGARGAVRAARGRRHAERRERELMELSMLLVDPRLHRPRCRCRCCWPALPGCIPSAPASSTSASKARCWWRPSPPPRSPRSPARAWLGLLARHRRRRRAWRWCMASPRITQRGNQIVSGVAINILAAGADRAARQCLVRAGRPHAALAGSARFAPIDLPFADALRDVPVLGPIYAELISGHNSWSMLAFCAVPLTWWVLYRTRFGLRLRAVGENPGGGRYGRHLGRLRCAIAA